MSPRSLYVTGKGVLSLVGGFTAGWCGLGFVEDKGLISEANLRALHVGTLKLHLFLQEWILPVSFSEKYGYKKEVLEEIIERYGSGSAAEARWTFEQLLGECEVPGQISWLEEHISEDIPYFYIADLFDSWCNLHRNLFVCSADAHETAKRSDDRFESELLCKGVIEKAISGVLPYDTAVRALCILAIGCRTNTQFMLKTIKPDFIMNRYKLYTDDLAQPIDGNTDVTPLAEVNAATIGLLNALNTELQEQEKLKLWKSSTARKLPLLMQLDATPWCDSVDSLRRGLKGITSNNAATLLEEATQYFRCSELSK